MDICTIFYNTRLIGLVGFTSDKVTYSYSKHNFFVEKILMLWYL